MNLFNEPTINKFSSDNFSSNKPFCASQKTGGVRWDRPNHIFRVIALFLAGLFLLPSTGHGLSSDRAQSITIQADSAERDEVKGTITYAGNVVMQQGSMRINAQKIVIYNERDKVTKIIALGQPAQYQQKPSESESLVVAKANTLEYNISEETLRLIEDASLQQEGTSLSGNFINYDVKKSVVKAGGNASENERVRMVIPARSLKQAEETTSTEAVPSNKDQ